MYRRHFVQPLSCYGYIYVKYDLDSQQHGAAGIARRAHNPEVPRSKRGAAKYDFGSDSLF